MATISGIKDRILDKTIRGELVPQLQEEKPASFLLEQIREEKQQLIKEKKIKKQKPFPAINEEEIPFELPKSWEWVRLGDVAGKLGAGKTPLGGDKNYTDTGIPFIRSQNVHNDGLSMVGIAYIPEEINETMQGSVVKKTDILLNITGGSIGRSCLLPDDFVVANVNQHVAIIRLIKPEIRYFLHTCIISPYFQEEIMRVQVGASREGLSMDKLSQILVPLPPYEEQIRIQAKLESLWNECRKLEQEVEFQTKTAQSLNNKLLEDALSGLFVPSIKEEGTAAEFLQKIEERKEQLIKEKKWKRAKTLPPIEPDEMNYDLPEGWEWVRLGDLSKVIHYGYTASATDKDTGVRMVRITDIQDDKVNWNTVPFCDIEEDSIEKYQLSEQDILIARTGGTVGKSFLVDHIKGASVFASYLIRIQLFEEVNAQYVKKFLDSGLYWSQIEDKAKGTGQANVNATNLSQLVIPLPPVKEQERIVERVEGLLSYLNEFQESRIQ